ncbi:hypothetical protein JYU34_013987 [Plutella xylostella]|uniref:Uncharacterized protein n=1 Tax=Plutella xylostella TaxID=51655 RepID=A0ABQ7Q7G7_PLUXY|nr:hypothetical protein JYU34_013987 [Plutella xylostella]
MSVRELSHIASDSGDKGPFLGKCPRCATASRVLQLIVCEHGGAGRPGTAAAGRVSHSL